MPFDVYKSFLPECYLDTNLVEVLLNKPNSVNHQKGVPNIAVRMQGKLKDTFVVALIDDDKRKVKELASFNRVAHLCRPGLNLLAHPVRKHFLIQLSPAIEQWVLNECSKGSIDPAAYKLPVDLKEWRKFKGLSQRSDPRFGSLFFEMTNNEACDEIIELKRWLLFFREHHYNSNLETL